MRIIFLCLALVLGSAPTYGASEDQFLMDAIRDGNVKQIKDAVGQGANVNSDGANLDPALPPLIFAISINQRNVVGALLNHGADPNLIHRGHHPLDQAVNADSRVLRLMLDAKANPNTHTSLGDTPLHRAASCSPQTYIALAKEGHYKGSPPNCRESLRLLIKAGADVNAPGLNGRTPLTYAITFNNVVAAKQLLRAGANVEAIGTEGTTALMLALDEYASEMYVRRSGRIPTFGSHVPMIRLLLENHANPNVKSEGTYDEYEDARRMPYSVGTTPLTLAARYGWVRIVKLLLEHNADLALSRSDGLNAIAIAEKHSHSRTVTLIRSYQKSRSGSVMR